MKVSVVVTTYDKPYYLRRALTAYACQDFRDFEVVVADDGSDDRTRAMIDVFRADAPFPIRHVWHEHRGFRKTVILNKALAAAATDYIVFTDDDCLIRADFLRCHATLAKHGWFLSGGVVYLPAEVSAAVTTDDVTSQRVFDPTWHRERKLALGLGSKLNKRGWAAWLMDHVSPTQASFNGHNASAWRADLVAVNGFDERLGYGGLDRELGERLNNAGVRGKRIRYRAVCLHLHHERGYRDAAVIARNRALRQAVRRERRAWTEFGLTRAVAAGT